MYGREELEYHIISDEDLYEEKVYLKNHADNVMDAMEARIKELESQLPKWISVEDVLPQWGKLVKIKFKDGKEDERRFSADYKWVSKGMQTCKSVNVTHWQPLPPTTDEK